VALCAAIPDVLLGTAPSPPLPGPSITQAQPKSAYTLSHTRAFLLPAGPERVFELLCPVREYDWLEGWKCEMIHSFSGYAEENCVFTTSSPMGDDESTMLWVCTRYDKPREIEYTRVAKEGNVFRLKISVEAHGRESLVTWRRTWIALGSKGEAWSRAQTPQSLEEQPEQLRAQMDHYLRTGSMLTHQ